MLRVGFLKERKKMKEEVSYLKGKLAYQDIESKAYRREIEFYRDVLESASKKYETYDKTIAQLKVENQALKDALKIATSDREVEPWKLALDDDIEQYILKEGQDGREKQEAHCHCGRSCKVAE